jgi:hypothetical protein
MTNCPECRRKDEVIKALTEYRNNSGLQHAWDCDSGIPDIGKRPCDCGLKRLCEALALAAQDKP